MGNTLKTSVLLILFHIWFISAMYGEGTKQLMPTSADICELWPHCFFGPYPAFAASCAGEDGRLNVRIASTSEKLYFGFGAEWGISVTYSLFAPNGTLVLTGTLGTGSQGYVTNYNQVCTGPSAIAAGGYNAIMYQPLMTGDYYFEFAIPSTGKMNVHFFDITVASSANAIIDGRVWSKNWVFATMDGQRRFKGKFYIYSDDHIVTEVSFKDFIPDAFAICSNATGCYNTGDLQLDRKSQTGLVQYGQYKVFLNNPDPVIFPSGYLSGVSNFAVSTPSCDGVAFITFNSSVAGVIDLVIHVNPAVGIQPEDVTIVGQANVGINSFMWNGFNGLGQEVGNGTPIRVEGFIAAGLTNLPLYDAEDCVGIKVNLIRPSGPTPSIYWDDTNISGGTSNLNGCTNSTSGCHSWSYFIGETNTINSWWYALKQDVIPVNFRVRRNSAQTIAYAICSGDSIYLAGQWRKTAGTFISGGLSVLTGCDSTRTDILTVNSRPLVNLGPDMIMCDGEPLTLNAGACLDCSYIWNSGQTTSSITVTMSGVYYVVVTTNQGCSSSDEMVFTHFPVPPPGVLQIKHN